MLKNILSRSEINYQVANVSLVDIINYNEMMVMDILQEVYNKDPSDDCWCEICVEDIYALALNNVPPRYIQATSIENYTNSESYVTKDEVSPFVMDALEKVHNSPRH